MIRRTISLDEAIDNAVSIMARLDNCNYSEAIRRIIVREISNREKELEEDE